MEFALATCCVTLAACFLGLLSWSAHREQIWSKERNKLVNRLYAKNFIEYAQAPAHLEADSVHLKNTDPKPVDDPSLGVRLPDNLEPL